MFAALLRVQLASVRASLFRSSKKEKRRGIGMKLLIAVLAVYVVGVFVLMFGAMFDALAVPLHETGLDWFYFAMGALMAIALCFIGSVFTAQQQLFNARDNELLLSMPVPPRYILGSRMAVLLGLNYALELVVLVPVGVVWLMNVGSSAMGIVCFVLCALLLPFLILTLTCLFAWLLAAITARMRNKTIVTMVLYLIFLAAYFYIYMNFQTLLTELITNSSGIAGSMSYVYPIYAFGTAVASADALQLAAFAACCLVPFALVCAILSRGFLAVTTRRPSAKKAVYRERELKVGTAAGAMLRKELSRFASNGMYILNAALGTILTLAAAVALLIYRETLIMVLAILPEGWMAAFIVIALCFLCATDVISAPSISLEGRTLWLLKSLPVSAFTVLMSKVNLHLVVALPVTLIASVICVAALPFSAAEAAAVILIPALMTLFGALFGVVMNLKLPKFDYINETAVVKNSASVMVTMFASWGVLAAPCILYGFVLSDVLGVTVFLYICAAALAAACAALYFYLKHAGSRLFMEL